MLNTITYCPFSHPFGNAYFRAIFGFNDIILSNCLDDLNSLAMERVI